MQAILARAFGAPDVLALETLPDPVPGPGQIRVRLHAVGVNPYDTYMRNGGYAINPPLPYTPGADGAGVVDAVGEGVRDWAPGARVYIGGTATHQAYGAYASHVLCTPEQVHALPAHVEFAQGAGVHVPCLTAWRALERGQAQPGDAVFVHGATGGVGLACVQMARARGCRVIASAGTEAGAALAAAEGAHHVVRHDAAGYLDEVTALTDGRGPDVIVEMLANVNLDHDLTVAARDARIVIVGNRGRVEIDPRRTMGKELTVTGIVLWGTPAPELRRAHAAVGAMLEARTLRPVVGETLPLAEAAEAHRRIMAPGHRGKIVLVP